MWWAGPDAKGRGLTFTFAQWPETPRPVRSGPHAGGPVNKLFEDHP